MTEQRKKTFAPLILFVILSWAVAWPGLGMAEQKTVRLSYVEWSETVAATNMVKTVIQERLGHACEIIPMTADKMWKAFDRNGDGRADLIGCNAGWGCERVVEHHLVAYGLRGTVTHVQGDYSPLMDDTIARYRAGKPVLFYTWTPNWTVGELVPGDDVVWLQVPFPSIPAGQLQLEPETVVAGIPGCPNDPCALGFPPNDIRSVANRVVTLRSEPFVIYRNGRYEGFSVDLWDQVARMLDIDYEVYGVNTIAKLLDDIQRGVAGIGITSDREKRLDFSHAYYSSGLQIMVREGSGSVLKEVFAKVQSVLFSTELIYAVGLFLIILMIAAHIIWILERNGNPQFPRSYPRGIWQSIWWAVVTVTTVGYGDATPKGSVGRLFGIVWILAGYFVFAYFTASVTTTATVQELHGTINGPEDLFGKRVASVARSTVAEYLTSQGMAIEQLENVDRAYGLLESGKIDAVVYDAPVLQHYAAKNGKGKARVVGLMFQEKSYGMAMKVRSPYRDKVNVALLRLMEEGLYRQIKDKWFGPRS